MKLAFTAFVWFASILVGFTQPQLSRDAVPFDDLDEAESYLKDLEAKGAFSGAVLISERGKTLLTEAYGMANKENGHPNTTSTKFNIGSINKAFTAVCVMQLVEAGKIQLEDKIVEYIPELKMPMANEITIRNLLEMRSGLGSYWDSELFQKQRKSLNDIEDYLPIIAAYELSGKPGTKMQYSNSNYELLGILVQRVSEENYFSYVRKNVYEKVGMKNTDAYEHTKEALNLAQGYTNYTQGEALRPGKIGPYDKKIAEWQAVKGSAAGGGYSTLEDLQKFLLALNNNELLSKLSTNLVINKFRTSEERKNLINFRGGSYGINAVAAYDIANETIIIVLSNYDPPSASAIANRLIATIEQEAGQAPPVTDTNQINLVIEQFQQCIESKNLDEFIALFVAEEKVSWVGNGSFGKQFGSPSGFIKMLQSTPKSYREDFHNIKIWNDDLIATVTFDYGFFGNDRLSNWGKESWMLIKQKGEWKITSVNYSMILPHQKAYPFEKK